MLAEKLQVTKTKILSHTVETKVFPLNILGTEFVPTQSELGCK